MMEFAPSAFDFHHQQQQQHLAQRQASGRRPSCQPICPSDALDLLDSSACLAVLGQLAWTTTTTTTTSQLPKQHQQHQHPQAAFQPFNLTLSVAKSEAPQQQPRHTHSAPVRSTRPDVKYTPVAAPSRPRSRPRSRPQSPRLRKKKARATRHMPKEASAYRMDGEWTTFLTDLPTVDLNAFLKGSHFSNEQVASLKKERRKRKCTVYTKRFRQKKRGSQDASPGELVNSV